MPEDAASRLEALRWACYHVRMELKMDEKRKAGAWTLVCVLALAVLLSLLIWRVPRGYDWTDESYYSAIAYRLLNGDRLLVDTWEVHQFSAVLAAPVLGAYLLANHGSADGCMLFLRYFYVSFQLLVSVYAFFVFKKKSGHLAAFFGAAMLLGFSHYAINSYFYDSMALLFSVLSALLVFDYSERKRGGWMSALSGAAYAASIMAFPHFVLSLPVYIGYWWIRIKRSRPDKREVHGALWFFGGAAAVACLLIGLILSKASLSEVAGGVSGMLSDPDHPSIGIVHVLGSYLNALRVLYGPVSYGAVSLLALGVWSAYAKRPSLKRNLRMIGTIAAILLMFGVSLRAYTYDWAGYHRINLLAAGLAMIAPGLYFLSGRKADRAIFLYCLGCALSIATQVGSNTRILAASGMLLPASVATVIYLFDQKETLFRFRYDKGLVTSGGRHVTHALYTAAAIACAVFVAALFTLRVTAVYRDEPVAELDTKMESGAAKGIYTTLASAERHDRLVADIRSSAPDEGSILIVSLFPEGYMLTGLSVATPSAYTMRMDSAWLAIYYEKNPQRRPDVVFVLDPDMDFNNRSMEGSELFENDPDYTETTLPSGTAYRLQTD